MLDFLDSKSTEYTKEIDLKIVTTASFIGSLVKNFKGCKSFCNARDNCLGFNFQTCEPLKGVTWDQLQAEDNLREAAANLGYTKTTWETGECSWCDWWNFSWVDLTDAQKNNERTLGWSENNWNLCDDPDPT